MSNNAMNKTAEEIHDQFLKNFPSAIYLSGADFNALLKDFASQFQQPSHTTQKNDVNEAVIIREAKLRYASDVPEMETGFIKGAMWVLEQQPSPSVEQMAEALKTTLEALKDLVRQLPTDENLADYRLDFAELAEQKAIAALSSRPLPQADKVENAVNEMKYWKTRCHLAETCMKESPCDPDITTSQIEAHKAYDEFVNSTPNH